VIGACPRAKARVYHPKKNFATAGSIALRGKRS